jgi:hypothetical protein
LFNIKTQKYACKKLTIVVIRYFPFILKHLFPIVLDLELRFVHVCSGFATIADDWLTVCEVELSMRMASIIGSYKSHLNVLHFSPED